MRTLKDSSIGSEEEVNTYKFDFLYLSHPRSVVSFDWRKTVEKNRYTLI